MNQPARVPMLISTDQEQGVVVHVGEPATQFPGNMALGTTRNTAYARTAATITGRELRTMGINQNFAPVADVNVNAQNPVIGVRSCGSNPDLVSGMVAAQVAGFQSGAGIASTAKHRIHRQASHPPPSISPATATPTLTATPESRSSTTAARSSTE